MQKTLHIVRARIAHACQESRRDNNVTLLAVSKNQPLEAMRTLVQQGQRQFAESYVQEAIEKMAVLGGAALEWHFIGPIQSNKTRAIAEHFDWVHSVDRAKIARRLNDQRTPGLAPLNVCLQINISGENSKSGCTPDELPALAQQVSDLPSLRLRGLMALPAASNDPVEQRASFARVRVLFERLQHQGYTLDTLSMGMSQDLEAAIAEGATMVRVGTALFGPRRA